MQHQAQDDARQDEVIERAAKVEAQRKQAEADRQAAARAALLAEVLQGRQEQIVLHERHKLRTAHAIVCVTVMRDLKEPPAHLYQRRNL